MPSYASLYNGDGPFVLNKRLLPLTLGHVVHLTNADSLFLKSFKLRFPRTKPEMVSFVMQIQNELGKAISICSMTYEEHEAWKWNPEAKRKWYKKFNRDIVELEKIGKLDLLDSVYLINEYVDTAHKLPRFIPTPSRGPSTAPPPQIDPQNWYVPMIRSLCEAYNQSKMEILNQQIQVSILDCCYHAQANREGRILPDGENDYIESTRTKNVTPELKQKLAETLAKHMRKSHG